MTRIALLGLLLTLNGCGGLSKPDEKAGPATPTPAPTPLLNAGGETFKAVLREGNTPQSFSVALSWTSEAEKVSVYRESASRTRQLLATFDRTVREWVDTDLPPGETVTYYLTEEIDLGRTAKVQVPVPRDVEVTGRMLTKRISKIHRLFLRKGAEVIGSDGQLEIEVDEILADDATLRAYAPDSVASVGNAGHAAEYVVVRARKGAGILNVIANGQQGGQGVPGLDGAVGTVGRTGLTATVKFAFAELFNDPPPHFPADDEVVKNLTAGKPPGDDAWKIFTCHTPPTDGGTGGVGGKGGRGSAGARGGDGGNILVQVANGGGLKVIPLSMGGVGGAAGRGGPGGKGGPGGPAGYRDQGELCPAAKAGAVGPVGPEGDPGVMGPVGTSGFNCLKLGSSAYGDCDKLPMVAPYVN